MNKATHQQLSKSNNTSVKWGDLGQIHQIQIVKINTHYFAKNAKIKINHTRTFI